MFLISFVAKIMLHYDDINRDGWAYDYIYVCLLVQVEFKYNC